MNKTKIISVFWGVQVLFFASCDNKEENKRREEDRKRNEEVKKMNEAARKEHEDKIEKEKQDREKRKEDEKRENEDFIKSFNFSKNAEEILKKICVHYNGNSDEKNKIRKIKELEELCNKENLKIIEGLDENKIDKIINNITYSKDEWKNIFKIDNEAFVEFLKLNEDKQKIVLFFDKDKLLPILTKELMQNLLTILSNDDVCFRNKEDTIKKELIEYVSFTPEVIKIIATKTKKEQTEFFVTYCEIRSSQTKDSEKLKTKIDKVSMDLYEEIYKETKTSEELIKAGTKFWYSLISSGIKLEKDFQDILISLIDKSVPDFWKRVKFLLKKDKFKTFDRANLKTLLNVEPWLSWAFSNDEDFENMAEWLMFTIDLQNGKDLIENIYFKNTLICMKNFAPYLVDKKELAKKINQNINAIQIYKTLYDPFDSNKSKVESLKSSDFKEIEKIIEDFMNNGGTDLQKLKDDLNKYLKSI